MTCVHAKGEILSFENWAASLLLHPLDVPSIVEYNVKHHFAALSIKLNKARKDKAA